MPLLPILSILIAAPHFESFNAPGFREPVCGVWYSSTEAVSPFPLGGLGTGFIEFKTDGSFGSTSCENDWLKPEPIPPTTGFEIQIGQHAWRSGSQPEGTKPFRFWGHFPAVDLDFGDFGKPVTCYLRAFSPLVPQEYEDSGLPIVFFRFSFQNKGNESLPCRISLHWAGKGNLVSAPGIACLAHIPATSGSYAIGWQGKDWQIGHTTPIDGNTAISAEKEIGSNQTVELVFALAWYFPQWLSSDGETLTHQYTQKYAGPVEIISKLLGRAEEIDQKICTWQERIYRSTTPAPLKDAVINSQYILARNSWWISDGRFFQSESFTGCPITETFVCRFYGSIPLSLFWPKLEQATMRQIAEAQAPTGEIPFGFGHPTGSRSPYYHCQHPIVSTEYVLVHWRNLHLWGSRAPLNEVYPSVKKALQFGMTLDKDQDGLIDEDPGSETGFPANQYYDIWPWWGVSSYTASLWLAALQAGQEMAERMKDTTFIEVLRDWFHRASQSFESKLWTGQYYRLYSDTAQNRHSDTLLTNALCGQWFTSVNGLPDIIPRNRLDRHIRSVVRLNVAVTPYGAVNGVHPDGSVDESFKDHSAVITIGEVWNFCAMMAAAGMQQEAIDLFEKSYSNIALTQKTPWNIPWSLDRETGAIKWGIHYYSNPCVWSLFQVMVPDYFKE